MAKLKFSIPLHFQILIMLLAGGFFGYYFASATAYTNWVGEIFLRALNMIIVPLILFSITSGVASVGSRSNLGRLGLKTESEILSEHKRNTDLRIAVDTVTWIIQSPQECQIQWRSLTYLLPDTTSGKNSVCKESFWIIGRWFKKRWFKAQSFIFSMQKQAKMHS